MLLPPGKKIYFASDFHLGIPDRKCSQERERRICRWLEAIRKDAAQLYLAGDLFDTWLEYKNVIPKGHTRFLGKLAELRDSGLHIEAFTGNHDLWMRGYFEEELGIPVHHGPITRTFNDKQFFIAHGDGLGPGDRGYKLLKGLLRSPLSQWLFRRLHPDTGVGMASWFSQRGPKHGADEPEDSFKGEDKEYLVQFCLQTLAGGHFYDYFIFGHRHLALDYPLPQGSRYINLGDWLRYNSYAVFDGQECALQFFEQL